MPVRMYRDKDGEVYAIPNDKDAPLSPDDVLIPGLSEQTGVRGENEVQGGEALAGDMSFLEKIGSLAPPILPAADLVSQQRRNEVLARYGMSWPNTSNLEEKQKILQRFFPSAEVGVQDNEGRLSMIVKMPGSDHFVELDTDDKTFGDFVDIVGETVNLTTIAGAAPLAFGAGVPGFLGVAARSALTAGATAAGFKGENAVLRALGVETTPPEQVYNQSGVEGLTAGLFEMGGGVLTGAHRLAGGMGTPSMELAQANRLNEWAQGFVGRSLPPEAVMEIARAEGFLGLSPADVNPTMRRVLNQAIMTDPVTEQASMDRLEILAKSLQGQAQKFGPPGSLPTEELERIAEVMRRDVERMAGIPPRGSAIRDGQGTLRGLKKLEDYRDALHDRLFDDVRAEAVKGNISFDISAAPPGANESVLATARRLKEGQRAQGARGMRPQDGYAHAPAGDVGATGMAPDPGYPEGMPVSIMGQAPEIRVDTPLTSDLNRLMDDILTLQASPEMSTFTTASGLSSNAYDQIRKLRTRAFRLIDSANPDIAGSAAELHHVLKMTMENPGGTVTKPFRTALDKANTAYRNTETMWGKLDVRQILSTFEKDPAKAASYFVKTDQPGQIAKLYGILKSAGRAEDFDYIRRSFKDSVLADPVQGIRRVTDWQKRFPNEFNRILDPEQQASLLSQANSLKSLQASPIVRSAQEVGSLGSSLVDQIIGSSPEEIERIVLAAGGKDTPMGRQLRQSVWANIYERATAGGPVKGRTTFRRGQFNKEVEALRNTGKLDLIMTPEELSDLEHVGEIASFFEDAGAGESMAASHAASTVYKYLGLPLSIAQVRAYGQLGRNALFGRMMLQRGRFNRRLAKQAEKFGRTRIGLSRPFAEMLAAVTLDWQNDAISLFGYDPTPIIDTVASPMETLQGMQRGVQLAPAEQPPAFMQP